MPRRKPRLIPSLLVLLVWRCQTQKCHDSLLPVQRLGRFHLGLLLFWGQRAGLFGACCCLACTPVFCRIAADFTVKRVKSAYVQQKWYVTLFRVACCLACTSGFCECPENCWAQCKTHENPLCLRAKVIRHSFLCRLLPCLHARVLWVHRKLLSSM